MVTKPKTTTKKTSWNDLKRALAEFDRNALLGLLQDLYVADKDSQAFLHARFGLGDDVLKPYKATISRWVAPDIMRNQDISVAKAKKAISDYKKAVGTPDGLVELSVFYCEACIDFFELCGMDDAGYCNALVRMFEQALKAVSKLSTGKQALFLECLDDVQSGAENYGYGMGEEMEELMVEYGFAEE